MKPARDDLVWLCYVLGGWAIVGILYVLGWMP